MILRSCINALSDTSLPRLSSARWLTAISPSTLLSSLGPDHWSPQLPNPPAAQSIPSFFSLYRSARKVMPSAAAVLVLL